MPPYLVTRQQQYDYSKKKLPELHDRRNKIIEERIKEDELLDGKINRHQFIVDDFEMNGDK